MNIKQHRPATRIVTLTIGAVLASGAGAQQANAPQPNGANGNATPASSVQIYGMLATSINLSKVGDARMTYVDDNGSRLGFRGSEDLGGNMRALFGLELGFDASSGQYLTPPLRTSYVGLTGNWGTMAMGRLDSANPTGSPIYSQMTQIVNFAPADSGVTQIGTPMFNARNRISNAIGYQSPNMGPFLVRARYYFRGLPAAIDDENLEKQGKSLDLGLNYAAGPLRWGVSYGHDSRSGGLVDNEMKQKWQTGARYDFGGIEPYLLYGRESYKNTAKSRSSVEYGDIGGRFYSGPHQVIVNIMRRDIQLSKVAVRKKQQAAYLYALSKRTELQLFVDRDVVDNTKPNLKKTSIATGVRHVF